MRESERLLSIGQFATLCGMPASTLRFYDEKGILRPLRTDPETGYRHYALEQLEAAVAVRVLRELDVPLEEIRDVFDVGPAEVERLLAHHRLRIMERRSELERMTQRLDRLLAGGPALLGYHIEAVDQGPLPVVSRRRVAPQVAIDDVIDALVYEIHETIGARAAAAATPREVILYHDILRRDGLVDVEVCVPLRKGSSRVADAWELPGGRVARTLHHGPWDDVYLAYAALLSWVLHAGHDVKGPLREVYTVDDRDTPQPSDYVTELTWLFV